jgi:hypothetical protein
MAKTFVLKKIAQKEVWLEVTRVRAGPSEVGKHRVR